MSELSDLTVAQLKELLKEAGLPVSGKKADLIARLEEVEEHDDEIEEAPAEEEEEEDWDDEDEEDWDDEEEYFHVAKQKPDLDDSTKAALEARKAQKKTQPKFRRQEWFRYRRLSRTGWRKPKGYQSSQRLNRKYRSPMARVGYGKIASVRNLHPSGFEEVLVYRPEDLDVIDPAVQAARVGGTVGGRKRILIHERADELGIRVLNRRRGI
ncbi:MAG TPA: 50S ribosomal protein L32e [Candidatus Thalassarchaeaceae archaeon]|jgi:large subunit ribosomal protein L32e|nr:50S ribosomal protein L32e [Candidatus Thalassarchaeaceae archaeon]HJM67734.1 50S ribosomal protein L32e [Candidatus Thalassarchaeaceae archaeon]